MDRRTRNLFAVALVAIIAVTGGAAVLFSSHGVGGSGSRPSVSGVIVGVESEGVDRVRGFTLRTDEGVTMEFALGTLEKGAEFPPGHLVEHQATAQPVRVWYVVEGDTRLAVRIEDAP
ncbi:MAG: hypothetical protein WEE50_04370 [Chloroflexota bacterium]